APEGREAVTPKRSVLPPGISRFRQFPPCGETAAELLRYALGLLAKQFAGLSIHPTDMMCNAHE
ncbi:MAG: hypothetical protein L0H29_08270, partial [Sinobacteraceae bacterium]|nr:hypothetical protein [Nevskiaceae bacterium]